MIDYIKLKEAHELMLILSNNNGCSLRLTFCDGKFWKYFLQINDKKDIFEFNCIDDLITKLKDLTKPKPKYEVGQMVYWTFDGLVYCGIIYYFFPNENRYQIKIEEHWINLNQSQLYPSREALIEAQIEYWQSLKEPVKPEDMRPKFEGEPISFRCFDDEMEVGKCKHESDGISYGAADYGAIAHYRCKKCGEFYK